MMKYTRIPVDTFQKLQLNAGILLSNFTPATGSFEESAILGATSGGANFTATPSFLDFGDDIDNCPKNMKELKEIDEWDVQLSGTFLSISAANAKMLVGAADTATVESQTYEVQKITPRQTLENNDFSDIWWVGDYGKGGLGFIAIHLINGLNTGGFQIQTGDKAKGTFPFTITGHYSMANQTVVPFEVYTGVESGE